MNASTSNQANSIIGQAVANALSGEKTFHQVNFPDCGDVELTLMAGVMAVLEQRDLATTYKSRLLRYLAERFESQAKNELGALEAQDRAIRDMQESWNEKLRAADAGPTEQFTQGALPTGQISFGPGPDWFTSNLSQAQADSDKALALAKARALAEELRNSKPIRHPGKRRPEESLQDYHERLARLAESPPPSSPATPPTPDPWAKFPPLDGEAPRSRCCSEPHSPPVTLPPLSGPP